MYSTAAILSADQPSYGTAGPHDRTSVATDVPLIPANAAASTATASRGVGRHDATNAAKSPFLLKHVHDGPLRTDVPQHAEAAPDTSRARGSGQHQDASTTDRSYLHCAGNANHEPRTLHAPSSSSSSSSSSSPSITKRARISAQGQNPAIEIAMPTEPTLAVYPSATPNTSATAATSLEAAFASQRKETTKDSQSSSSTNDSDDASQPNLPTPPCDAVNLALAAARQLPSPLASQPCSSRDLAVQGDTSGDGQSRILSASDQFPTPVESDTNMQNQAGVQPGDDIMAATQAEIQSAQDEQHACQSKQDTPHRDCSAVVDQPSMHQQISPVHGVNDIDAHGLDQANNYLFLARDGNDGFGTLANQSRGGFRVPAAQLFVDTAREALLPPSSGISAFSASPMPTAMSTPSNHLHMCVTPNMPDGSATPTSSLAPMSTLHSPVQARSASASAKKGGAAKRERPKTHTPRPANSFILYRREKHIEIMAQYKGSKTLNNNVISKIVADMWRSEVPEIKARYAAMADEEKRAHMAKYPDYKYRPRKNAKKAGVAVEACKDAASAAGDDELDMPSPTGMHASRLSPSHGRTGHITPVFQANSGSRGSELRPGACGSVASDSQMAIARHHYASQQLSAQGTSISPQDSFYGSMTHMGLSEMSMLGVQDVGMMDNIMGQQMVAIPNGKNGLGVGILAHGASMHSMASSSGGSNRTNSNSNSTRSNARRSMQNANGVASSDGNSSGAGGSGSGSGDSMDQDQHMSMHYQGSQMIQQTILISSGQMAGGACVSSADPRAYSAFGAPWGHIMAHQKPIHGQSFAHLGGHSYAHANNAADIANAAAAAIRQHNPASQMQMSHDQQHSFFSSVSRQHQQQEHEHEQQQPDQQNQHNNDQYQPAKQPGMNQARQGQKRLFDDDQRQQHMIAMHPSHMDLGHVAMEPSSMFDPQTGQVYHIQHAHPGHRHLAAIASSANLDGMATFVPAGGMFAGMGGSFHMVHSNDPSRSGSAMAVAVAAANAPAGNSSLTPERPSGTGSASMAAPAGLSSMSGSLAMATGHAGGPPLTFEVVSSDEFIMSPIYDPTGNAEFLSHVWPIGAGQGGGSTGVGVGVGLIPAGASMPGTWMNMGGAWDLAALDNKPLA